MKLDTVSMIFSVQTSLTASQLKKLEAWAKKQDKRVKDVPASGLVQLHSALGKRLDVEAHVQRNNKPTIITIRKGE